MNFIITVSSYKEKKEIFEHKLKALCLEYDMELDEIYSKEDLAEFVSNTSKYTSNADFIIKSKNELEKLKNKV